MKDNTFTITCPNCNSAFLLDETLAGPMIAQVRREADANLKRVNEEHAKEKQSLLEEKDELAKKARALAERE